MKLVPLLAVILLGCGTNTSSTTQDVSCYNTGFGSKCVPTPQLPAGATALCHDKDGEARDEGDDHEDGSPGEAEHESCEDDGHGDGDGDGVSNENDCDCVPLPPPDPGADRVRSPDENVSRSYAGASGL